MWAAQQWQQTLKVVLCDPGPNNTSKGGYFTCHKGAIKMSWLHPVWGQISWLSLFTVSGLVKAGVWVKPLKGRSSCGVDTVPHWLNGYLRIVCVCVRVCVSAIVLVVQRTSATFTYRNTFSSYFGNFVFWLISEPRVTFDCNAACVYVYLWMCPF